MKWAAGVRRPPNDVALRVRRVVPSFWYEFPRRLDAGLGEVARDLTVTSWWRDYASNRDVGGGAQSQHLIGTAMDLDGPEEALERARAGLASVGLIALIHAVAGGGRHLHVQAFLAGEARRAGLL